MYGGFTLSGETLWGVSPHPSLLHTPKPMTSPAHSQEVLSQVVLFGKLGAECIRPKNIIFKDFYIPDGRDSRLRQLNPNSSGMLI